MVGLPCETPFHLLNFTMAMQFEKKNPRVVISTKFGDMLVKLYPDAAPRHVENFINLTKIGFYNGICFHRVIPGFMIARGRPRKQNSPANCTGRGGPGYGLPPEPNDQPHKRGAISMAKMPRESNSTRDFNDSGSQVFHLRGGLEQTDRRYTVFGEVYRGIEVLDKIVAMHEMIGIIPWTRSKWSLWSRNKHRSPSVPIACLLCSV